MENSINLEDGSFGIKIQNKNPKENPVTYHMETVQDIFDTVTAENLPRFIKDFEAGLKVGIATRDLIISIAKAQGAMGVDANLLQMPSFDWIDD